MLGNETLILAVLVASLVLVFCIVYLVLEVRSQRESLEIDAWRRRADEAYEKGFGDGQRASREEMMMASNVSENEVDAQPMGGP